MRTLFFIFFFAIIKLCLCQGSYTINIDTIHYSTVNSIDVKDIAIINISNISSDELVLWISECADAKIPDSIQKHNFFFRPCGQYKIDLFRYFTDNFSLNYKNYRIGYSFIKKIDRGGTFQLIASLDNLNYYLEKTVLMLNKEFEKSFIHINDNWLYKYNVAVLDIITPAQIITNVYNVDKEKNLPDKQK